MSLIVNANYLRKVAAGLDLSTPTTFKLHDALIALANGFDAHIAVPGQETDTLSDYLAAVSGAQLPSEVAFTNAAEWDHTHSRDSYPDVLCVDEAGRQLRGGDTDYVSRNRVLVRFNSPVTGIMRIG